MALVLQAQPPHHHHARMQVFKGDQDHLLDKLIAASQLREVSLSDLQERTLVPYFDASDASTASYLATQPGRKQAQQSPPAHGLKRHAHERSNAHLAGSPPKKEAELLQAKHLRRAKQASGTASPASSSGGKGSAASTSSNSDTEMSSTPARKPRVIAAPLQARKHSRDTTATTTTASRAATAPSSGPQRAASAKRPSSDIASLDMRQLAAASAAAAASLRTPGKSGARTPPCPSKFAGPAFTNSPTPDCLPIPTSSLLFQDAADSLRSRLTL